jgi:hypothetical protein
MNMQSYHTEIVKGKKGRGFDPVFTYARRHEEIGREEVQFRAFSMSALHGGEASTLLLSLFITGEEALFTTNGEIVGLNRGSDTLGKGTVSCLWSELNHDFRSPAMKPNHYADNTAHASYVINKHKRK